MHVEPEHVPKPGKLDATEWLGEDIGRVLIPRDMVYCDQPLLDLLTDPMVGMVNVLHGALVFGVLQYLDG